jgi:hypothetical protein
MAKIDPAKSAREIIALSQILTSYSDLLAKQMQLVGLLDESEIDPEELLCHVGHFATLSAQILEISSDLPKQLAR